MIFSFKLLVFLLLPYNRGKSAMFTLLSTFIFMKLFMWRMLQKEAVFLIWIYTRAGNLKKVVGKAGWR